MGIKSKLILPVTKWTANHSSETNCIEEWEEKLDKIVNETHQNDMSLISGIPPWVQMYYERPLQRTGKSSIKEIFPNYNLFIYKYINR